MARLLTLRRNLARLLTRDEVDDNFVNVAADFSGDVDPAVLAGAYVQPYMRWADTGTGLLKRRNAANDGWVAERRLLRSVVQPFDEADLPADDEGPVYVNGQGMAEWHSGKGAYQVRSSVPLTTVQWWPLRSSIQAGWVPGDGQEVSRLTYPDLAQAVIDGLVPVVTETEWQADPLKRGSYTLGDGSTTIRVPDYNGKSAGSLGRVFLSGDGLHSAGVSGALQADQLGPMEYSVSADFSTATNLIINGVGLPVLPSGNAGNIGPAKSVLAATTGEKWIRNTGSETRPRNVTGCFVIRAFGTLVNAGSADAAQLAADYAVLNAAFQTLNNGIDFVILYPGGSEASPGVISANTRLVVANPFPGFAVHVVPEHYIQAEQAWGDPGWYSAYYTSPTTEGRAWGMRAGQYNNGDIVVVSGKNGTMTDGPLSGALFPQGQVNQGSATFRLKVWKLKGQV
ncbi:phage tail protein [Bordetella bronchiseptica]|uniref:phage tail protein n=1 Tax=Bordetella bronchiseptica TaxID=518 RepID=UPI0004614B20|nr:phage tail protein [Bordetella bronchiseptica]KDC15350.1 hypothetical protein L542_2136 [Bordetella bronchiseptica F-1]KDC29330.1 hypothetical protein L504_2165 [Bordetella bronchiseptica F2]